MVLVIIAVLAVLVGITTFLINYYKFSNDTGDSILYAFLSVLCVGVVLGIVGFFGCVAPKTELVNIEELEQTYSTDSYTIWIDTQHSELTIVNNDNMSFQTKIKYSQIYNSNDNYVRIQELEQKYVNPNWILYFGRTDIPDASHKFMVYLPTDAHVLYLG